MSEEFDVLKCVCIQGANASATLVAVCEPGLLLLSNALSSGLLAATFMGDEFSLTGTLGASCSGTPGEIDGSCQNVDESHTGVFAELVVDSANSSHPARHSSPASASSPSSCAPLATPPSKSMSDVGQPRGEGSTRKVWIHICTAPTHATRMQYDLLRVHEANVDGDRECTSSESSDAELDSGGKVARDEDVPTGDLLGVHSEGDSGSGDAAGPDFQSESESKSEPDSDSPAPEENKRARFE